MVAPSIGGAEVGPLAELRAAAEPTYVPAARAYLVVLTDDEAESLATTVDESLLPGLEHGVLALGQKCPHLGCRVPYCASSGWFECACHGAMFNRAGEHQAGPGPRGLDAHPVVVSDGVVSIDRAAVVRGAPVGTLGLDLPAIGPHCVDNAGH